LPPPVLPLQTKREKPPQYRHRFPSTANPATRRRAKTTRRSAMTSLFFTPEESSSSASYHRRFRRSPAPDSAEHRRFRPPRTSSVPSDRTTGLLVSLRTP
jgi:hypothetical protein